jgi:hypothetical protein
MNFALATMTKNQGNRLKEWVEHHSKLGFNKFIFYLDNCEDNSYEVLSNINNKDIIIYNTKDIDPLYDDPNWILRSHRVYNECLKEFSNLDWIGFIEVDEFIFEKEISIINFLTELKSDCLYINSWDMKGPFDESKPIIDQSKLVWSDEQRYFSDYRYRGKSIIKPSKFFRCVDAHHFSYQDKVSKQFKKNRENLLQIFYGDEVTIDDNLFCIYHFRNHSPKEMNKYVNINF